MNYVAQLGRIQVRHSNSGQILMHVLNAFTSTHVPFCTPFSAV
ncbi:rCG63688 [Rattus norvegicus]|uniref:RCG63688 n=1 Tax=Rattus norvegicus TaxID=10116 RepID=A6HQS3_RAT|nr:rCG63688 [Rattus norvegicus]